jgi:hypothetical protein
VNWAKNDVYASGLTVLDGMTLQMTTSDHFLDTSRLNQAKSNYSHFLFMVLDGMLKANPDERLSFFDIDVFLKPYVEQIKSMDDFSFDFDLIERSAKQSPYVNYNLISSLVDENLHYL